MECLGCGYDLRGLTERCPECGRGFDPADRGSFGPRDRTDLNRVLVLFSVVSGAWPLVSYGLLHLCRLAARVELGHWPRPSIDDPKDIGGLVPILYVATFLSMLLHAAALPASILLLGMAAFYRLWRAAIVALVAAVLGWTLPFVLGFLDRTNAGTWFMD